MLNIANTILINVDAYLSITQLWYLVVMF